MPAWLIPALKAVLPYVGTIVGAAAPAFTRKSADATANQPTMLQRQITELQAAASANDAHIKGLAAQMQNTVEVLEKAAAMADWRHQRMVVFCLAAMAVSLTSLGVALFLLVTK